jgi:hypothetical protein
MQGLLTQGSISDQGCSLDAILFLTLNLRMESQLLSHFKDLKEFFLLICSLTFINKFV